MSRFESAFCRTAAWGAFTRKTVLPWAVQGQQITGDVLEIGAGSGSMAAALVESSPDARLTATDFDPVMVAALSARLERYAPRARVQQADAIGLPFADASFDVVLSFIMLHHVVDWSDALAEAVRVLRPGGRLLGYDLLATPPWRALHWIERAPHCLLTATQLRAALCALPVASCAVHVAPGGHVARFSARA
ncbi:MAG TPA: class I SAM-dependent methyltransferase [Mycobacteriales bacterium]|nr:class I SAM-dependent methyltransferase [Mycobacteriales bacterium]